MPIGRFADDGAGHPTGVALLAVVREDRHELLDRALVDESVGPTGLTVVHPHVERTLSAVGEPPLRRVQLGRTDTEIEEGAHYAVRPNVGDGAPELVESAVMEVDPVAEASEPTSCGVDRSAVTVESEEPEVVSGVEERLCVTASTERGVDHEPRRDAPEKFDHPAQHDGDVDKGCIDLIGWTVLSHFARVLPTPAMNDWMSSKVSGASG